MQDNNDNIVMNSHVNVLKHMDSSRQDVNLDSDSNSFSSTTSVASIVSGESSIYYLPAEFESEDSSSENHHFINEFEFSDSFVSQVDAEVNFDIALSFSKTIRQTRNDKGIITIHKKKLTSKNERMMVLFTAIKWDIMTLLLR